MIKIMDNNEYRFGQRKKGVKENVLSQERLNEIKKEIRTYKAIEKVAEDAQFEKLVHENFVLRCRIVELEKIVESMRKELDKLKYGEERKEECD